LERQFAEVRVEVAYFSYTQATSSSRLRRSLQNIDELAKKCDWQAIGASCRLNPESGGWLRSAS
jgi:hypothetical protein